MRVGAGARVATSARSVERSMGVASSISLPLPASRWSASSMETTSGGTGGSLAGTFWQHLSANGANGTDEFDVPPPRGVSSIGPCSSGTGFDSPERRRTSRHQRLFLRPSCMALRNGRKSVHSSARRLEEGVAGAPETHSRHASFSSLHTEDRNPRPDCRRRFDPRATCVGRRSGGARSLGRGLGLRQWQQPDRNVG